MTTIIRIITGFIVTACIMSCASAFASDACKEAKQIWRERVSVDAQLRLKCVEIQQKIIDNKIKVKDMEKKMADIELEILKVPEKDREALWAQYDSISEQREKISKESEPLYDEYKKVSAERFSKKLQSKVKQMKKRYECMINEQLSFKLSDIVKRADEGKVFKAEEVVAFKELCKKRAAMIDYIKAEYEKYQKELDEKTALYEKSDYALEVILKESETHDREKGEYSDDIFNIFDEWQKTVDQYSDQISKISEQLLPYMQR